MGDDKKKIGKKAQSQLIEGQEDKALEFSFANLDEQNYCE